MNSGVIITSATKPSPSGKRFILFNIGGADGVIRCYRWERKKGYDTLHTSTEVGWMLIASSGNGENVGLSLANVLQGARTAISVVEFFALAETHLGKAATT